MKNLLRMGKSQMPVNVTDWKYPKVRVEFAPEDSSVIMNMEFQKRQETGLFDLVVRFRGDSMYHYFDVEEIDISQVLVSMNSGHFIYSESFSTLSCQFPECFDREKHCSW